MKAKLLATAPDMIGILAAIKKFYCGEPITLIETSETNWKLIKTHKGTELTSVRVTKKRGRYRFEML